jgi:hypothetical protein
MPVGEMLTEEQENDRGLVVVFREVDGEMKGIPPKYRKPKLSPSTFRLDSDGVSTFEVVGLPGNKPFVVAFVIKLIGPKLPQTTHPVVGIPTCTGTFTPQWGVGHWSLNCAPRESTPAALSAYGKTGAAIHPNPRWPRLDEVEWP